MDRLATEWAVIRGAPASVAVVVAIFCSLAWVALRWQYGTRIEKRNDEIADLKRKLENGSSERVAASEPTQPESRKFTVDEKTSRLKAIADLRRIIEQHLDPIMETYGEIVTPALKASWNATDAVAALDSFAESVRSALSKWQSAVAEYRARFPDFDLLPRGDNGDFHHDPRDTSGAISGRMMVLFRDHRDDVKAWLEHDVHMHAWQKSLNTELRNWIRNARTKLDAMHREYEQASVYE